MGIGATAQILVVGDSNTDRTHLCQLLADLAPTTDSPRLDSAKYPISVSVPEA